MNIDAMGKAIRVLRKRAGLTQEQLATMLDVTDKAVSKWERGVSYPDVSLLPKISIILDTDVESLLYGHHFQKMGDWCGILLLDDVSSIDEMICGKPLLYYCISNFLLVGIKEILIVSNNILDIESVLNDGRTLGITVRYETEIGDFAKNRNVAVLNGCNFYYGVDLTRNFQRAMNSQHSCELVIQRDVNVNERIYLDYTHKIVDESNGNTLKDIYCSVGFLFCRANDWRFVKKCASYHEMICDLKIKKCLYGIIIGRGMIYYHVNNCKCMAQLEKFVETIEEQQGELISCIEEIAWRRGLIDSRKLYETGEYYIGSGNHKYGAYIQQLAGKPMVE